MFKKFQQIHFVGIGGSGMSGIAEVLLTLGYQVTGSDVAEGEAVRRLRGLGGKITIGHRAENVSGAQVVVVSSAINPQNVEVQTARATGVPVIRRAEMLAELMRLKVGIAVAGAHGKTTTTSMIATVLAHGGLDPTSVVGGRLNSLGASARLGRGEFLIAEADESDGSFLKLSPTIAVVTSIDREHLDFYGTLERIQETFADFLNKVPFYGACVVCLDDPHVQALLPGLEKRVVTYGFSAQAELRGEDVVLKEGGARFRALFGGRDLGAFTISVPGEHNVQNALAAIAVGLELDIGIEAIRGGLAAFAGVERRFQIRGEKSGVMVVDDYGHHPTEIRATLAAAKAGWPRRRVVLFQPHRYTRTRDLMDDFATAFNDADVLILTEIYPAGEAPLEGISARVLGERIKSHGHRGVHIEPSKERLADAALALIHPGDMVITLGAGDIWKSGVALLERL